MNRANQQALIQQTNQGLLGIRQQEINYYLSLNIAFGTQAALIGGFTYCVFTQQPLKDDFIHDIRVQINNVCWVMSSATIATCVHVIINTMLLQVVAPGLALHGPVGSIVRATEGMKIEQQQIVFAFNLMIALFAFSTTLSFWVVMSFHAAIGSTIVFLIASRQWYYYTERIYLRFHWDAEKNPWDVNGSAYNSDEDDDGEKSPGNSNPEHNGEPGHGHSAYTQNAVMHDLMNPTSDKRNKNHHHNPLHSHHHQDMQNNQQRKVERSDSISSAKSTSTKTTFRVFKFFEKFRRATKISKASGASASSSSAPSLNKPNTNHSSSSSTLHSSQSGQHTGGRSISTDTTHTNSSPFKSNIGGDSKTIAMEGYLTKSGFTSTDKKKEAFERRYFTLSKGGSIFYFKTRLDFRDNPKNPINKRPLNLLDFNVLVANTDEDTRHASVDCGESVDGGPPLARKSSYSGFFSATGSVIESVTGSNASTPHDKHHFEMTLILKEEESGSKRWIFRVDTEEELEVWLSVMRQISPKSFEDVL